MPRQEQIHGQTIRKEGFEQGPARDARTQTWDAAQRPFWTPREEPQAGDRDRAQRGAAFGREGAAQVQFVAFATPTVGLKPPDA
jgi:hypothetical protein